MAPFNYQQGGSANVEKPSRFPAPGASPKGGTTSLPPYLQGIFEPKQNQGNLLSAASQQSTAGMTKASGAAPGQGWGTTPGQQQPTPASQPPGTVPGAPPATGPAIPPSPVPGATPTGTPGASVPGTAATPTGADQNAQMHDALFKQLMERITNPSRYDSAAVSSERQQGMQNLQDQRKIGENNAIADAARRGVYNGTPLTTSLGDIGTQYQRGLGEMEAKITQDTAARHNQDLNDAMNAIFTYGNAQLLSQQQQNDLWLAILNAGYGGGPGMPGASTQLPLPGQG